MAGYAVTARLGRIEPHLSPALAGAGPPSAVADASPWHPSPADRAVEAPMAPAVTTAPATVELVGRPFGEALADWLGWLNRACSQTFFYLFDPESWR